MIIVENDYYVFLLHANSIPSLAEVETHTEMTEINSLYT